MAVIRELIADAGRRSCLKSLAKDGSTVLHVAAAAGQAGAVQLLLDAGARTDARDRVSVAAWSDRVVLCIVQQLLQRGWAPLGRSLSFTITRQSFLPHHPHTHTSHPPPNTQQMGRTPLEVVPHDSPAVIRILSHGRPPTGARSPIAGASAAAAAAACAGDHRTPALSPCKSPTGLSVAVGRALRGSVASPGPASVRLSVAASSRATSPVLAAASAAAAAPVAPRMSSSAASEAPMAPPPPSAAAHVPAQVPAPTMSISPSVPTDSATTTVVAAAHELIQSTRQSQQWREPPQQLPELAPLRASLALAHSRSPPRKSPQQQQHRSPQQEGGVRRSLIGSKGPLHQHQSQRAEEENAKWQKVTSTVQGLLR